MLISKTALGVLKTLSPVVAEKAWNYLRKNAKKPVLTIKDVYVSNFNYIDTKPTYYRRFVIAIVENIGKTQARDCYGFASVRELSDVPLHWAGAVTEFMRNDTQPVNIPAGRPRDLDIAFSVYGTNYPGLSKTSGPVYKSTTTTTTYRTTRPTPGPTRDPNLIYNDSPWKGTLAPTGSRMVKSMKKARKVRELGGAWLATNMDIGFLTPKTNSPRYLFGALPRVTYDVELSVQCENSEYVEKRNIRILVGRNPQDLDFELI